MNALVPLGDQAALAYFADEAAALRFAAAVRRAAPPWLVDVVQAYMSVAVFFSLDQVGFADVAGHLRRVNDLPAENEPIPSRLVRIPCCYELALDMPQVAEYAASVLNHPVSGEEVIRLHTQTEYTVYAIGFCPGFPYMGYLPRGLDGVPRLRTPRVTPVAPGSVGVAGRQTGIYTEAKPGGWNLIGRTPLELVNVADGYFPLRTGDRIRFERIDEAEFARLRGQRL
jgi:inhibitor of KinA